MLCAQSGATAVLGSHKGLTTADAAARETGARFDVVLQGASTGHQADLHEALADADIVMGVAAAGVQVLAGEDYAVASRLRVAADINAVPPAGLAGVGVMDDAVPLAGTQAVAIGALAIGNVKYQVQNQLLMRMRESGQPELFGFAQAFAAARELFAQKAR